MGLMLSPEPFPPTEDSVPQVPVFFRSPPQKAQHQIIHSHSIGKPRNVDIMEKCIVFFGCCIGYPNQVSQHILSMNIVYPKTVVFAHPKTVVFALNVNDSMTMNICWDDWGITALGIPYHHQLVYMELASENGDAPKCH